MKKYNYVYVTTNLINGAQYVGDHSTNNLNDDTLVIEIITDSGIVILDTTLIISQIFLYFFYLSSSLTIIDKTNTTVRPAQLIQPRETYSPSKKIFHDGPTPVAIGNDLS
jgi:hypothetical protein